MKDELFRRRQRMLRLLAIGNSLKVVVETISKEFGVPKKTVYSDYYNMKDWAHFLQRDKQLSHLVKERLDLLNRELLSLVLEIESIGEKKAHVKERFLKVNAAIAALKVIQEQIKLGKNLGLIERKPEVIQSAVSLSMPFEASPEIKDAYAKFAEAQRAEKDATRKAESDAGR